MISIVVIPTVKENSNTSIISKLGSCLYFAVHKSVFIIIHNIRIQRRGRNLTLNGTLHERKK
jgi:hypothetical protein